MFSLALCLATLSFAHTLTLSPAPRASNASVSAVLSPSFAGFGIEPSHLFQFTGDSTPNALSIGLLQNLADYAGAPPHIRLGGNAQDYALYDANYKDFGIRVVPNPTSQGDIPADVNRIGPAFFEALDRFPTNTPITFGLNMAYSGPDYIEQIVKAAQAAVDNMKNAKLYSFEIGNEPDLYGENRFRNTSWNGAIYTSEFLTRADAIYNQALKPAGYPAAFFEAQATASTIGKTFEIELLVDDGILNQTNGNKYVSAWNQHDYFYFIGVSTSTLTLNDLMDFDNTQSQFAYWAQQTEIALKTGLPFVLREMASVGPIGMHEVSDTHGAALWTLNFFLYTATLNISSVQMHMTFNSNASAWQPIDYYGQPPHVRPSYYAHAAIAQIIGNGNATTQIGTLNVGGVNADYTGRLRAYSTYSRGRLQAVVLINSKQANASSVTKGNFTFELNLGEENVNKDVFLSYLTAPGADVLTGTTWNGVSYSDTDGTASIADNTVTSLPTSSNGTVSITVRDSQAVVVNIGYLLGSVPVTDSEGNIPEPTKTAGVPTCTGTAAPTGTTSCVENTGTKKKSEGERVGRSWPIMGACLVAVAVAFVGFA